jgi:hypothetical protein
MLKILSTPNSIDPIKEVCFDAERALDGSWKTGFERSGTLDFALGFWQ